MMNLEGWYINNDEDDEYDQKCKERKKNAQPFQKFSIVPDSELLKRLEQITEEMLPKIDPILHRHLQSLDIQPQLYGM